MSGATYIAAIIFLHFVAGLCYVAAGVRAQEHADKIAVFLFFVAVIATAIAAVL